MPPYRPFKPRQKKIIPLTQERLAFLALRYVARYAATKGMLNRVLQRHIDKAGREQEGFITHDALRWKQDLLKKAEEKNWINDADLTKRFIEHGKDAGLSRQRMQQKLLHKGVEKNLISKKFFEAAEEQSFDDMDLQAARIFARKKNLGIYRTKKDADPKKEIAKMCRAGFGFDIAMKALSLPDEEF